MQIGQILVEQRWVAPAALTRGLAEQRLPQHRGKRICSLLIARGLLDPDNAARALATLHNVPGVLQRHLVNRDRSLRELLSAEVARSCLALPIGRTRDGELIIGVRDPHPDLRNVLTVAVGGPVVIAVVPASQLEQLIDEVYGAGRAPGDDSYDVDLSTRPISLRDLPMAPMAPMAPTAPFRGGDIDVDLNTRPIAVLEPGELGDLGSMTLVGLDDVRVAKDPTQSGQLAAVLPRTLTSPHASGTAPRTMTPPRPPLPRTMTTPRHSSPPSAHVSARARTLLTPITAPPRPSGNDEALEAVLDAIGHAATRDDATDAAMAYLSVQFGCAVLFAISEGAALGDRGHGGGLTSELIQAITIPLSAPSVLQAAHDTRRLVDAVPPDAGPIQDRLARTLGNPRICTAVPVEVDHRVVCVITVGDASGDGDRAPGDLERLSDALGAAYQRLAA